MNINNKRDLKRKFYKQYKENVFPKILEMETVRQELLKTHNNVIYKKLIKEKCINELLSCFDFIECGSNPSIPICIKSLLNPDFGYITEDSFFGCYNNVKFQLTEAYAQIKYKKDVYGFTERFVFMNLLFNKKAKTNVHLCPQFKSHYNKSILICIIIICILILIGTWTYFFIGILLILIVAMLNNIYSNKSQEINLEDTNFEKNFYVECDNPVEARYILTPSFMERLNMLKTVYAAKNIWVEIENNQVTCAIQTDNDLFEIGDLYTPATDPKQIDKFFDEIILVTEIIDHFKLNENTGL